MNVIEKYKDAKISAVIRTDDKDCSLRVAKALIAGGIDMIEITVENPEMYPVVRELCETTDATIVAGGVITARQAQEVIKAGVKAVVSPIYAPNLVRLCQAKHTYTITTATTPNEAYQAWKSGVPLIKIFPVHQMGGAAYIEDLLRPMPFLNVIATGSIKIEDIADYLKAGACAVAIGRDFWKDATDEEIIQKAQAVVQMVKKL